MARLDFGHGFIKDIIRNQINRDNYDKEMKEKETSSNKKARSRKPEVQAYRPPGARQDNYSNEKRPLFIMAYEDEDGSIYELIVNKGDHHEELARHFGVKHGMPEPLIGALGVRLKQEIDLRNDSTNTEHSTHSLCSST